MVAQMATLKDEVVNVLAKISGPDGTPLPASGKLSEIVAADGKVFFSITVDASAVKQWESVRAKAEVAVRAVPGVTSAMVALTAERAGGAGAAPPRPQQRRRQNEANLAGMPRRRQRAFPASSRSSPLPPAKAASANRPPPSILRSACVISG